MKSQIVHQVDAFTNKAFGGNPAAVCILEAPAKERWMQDVAREMNLSETAFLHPEGEAWNLRWFTPAVEVDLCGHATLATAHVLWETGRLEERAPARFLSKSGPLGAEKQGGWIELDFPRKLAVAAPPPPGLIEALGVQPVFTGRSAFDWLVEVGSAAAVRAAAPDFGRLKRVEARGIVLTARSDVPEHDFVSRFFAPASGIDEDPVTGSAHCTLAPHWAGKLGRTKLRAFQASARGGTLRLRLDGERVKIGGQAVTVMRGELLV